MNGYDLTGTDFALVNHATETGGETTAKAGGGGEIHFIGQAHQIGIGIVNRDIFGKASPMGKARLELMITNLMIAAVAFRAMAAARNERDRDPVADFPAFDILANRFDGAGKFMAGNVGQFHIGIMAHPAVPVASAQPGRPNLDDNAVIFRCRIVQFPDFNWTLIFGEKGSAHDRSPVRLERL